MDMLNSVAAGEDTAPDWIWDSAGRLTETGYTVEIRLPLQSIRFKGGENLRMGILFWRRVSRIGVSVAVSGLAALALKEVAGRERPAEAPGDPDLFKPFSGHASFPSGHTTVAFAIATALSRETGARWAPWLAYPLAAAVGWSRVHDREHWTSDVVAGAALGTWAADRAERVLRQRDAARRVSLEITPERTGMAAAIGLRF